MKKLTILKCILLFLISAALPVQGQVSQTRLSLNIEKKSVHEALSFIEQESEFKFTYNSAQINADRIVSIHADNRLVTEILDDLFAGQNVKYSVKDKHIVLFKEEKKPGVPPQKNKSITGLVLDENNETVPGATVAVKGTPRGVMTDIDGTFAIEVSPSDVLEISFLGYDVFSVPVGQQSYISVKLTQKKNELDEVTIVAFGKQKKESVIGSITTINVKDLKVPSSNLTTAFAGQMAGIIAYQRSGEPGRDNADFFVRGITTFGANTSPLILIDNVELTSTDLARLQPDDIASFSIMKDATATALYGARGANGVILVTTKQGTEGPAKVSLRIENSVSAPTKNVEFADPVTYMRLANEAVLTRNSLGTLPYSQEKIDYTGQPGSNPYLYPANDWRKLLFKDYALNQRYNLNVSGGGPIARYYVAASFNKDNGILNVDKQNNFNNNISLNSYSLRANVNINVTKTTELAIRLNGNFDDYSGPIDPDTKNNTPVGSEIYNMAVHSNPVYFPAYFPKDEAHAYLKHIMFGNQNNNYTNPYAEMVKGYSDDSRSQMMAQFEARQDLKFITPGLSIRSFINISRLAQFSISRFYNPFYYQISDYDAFSGKYTLVGTNLEATTNMPKGTEYLDYEEGEKTIYSTLYSESALNYVRTFGKHDVSGVLVFTLNNRLNASARDQDGNPSLQLSLPFRNAGLSGRATYSFDSRYFGELNFGYNGSERFAANHRWGFFPSVGVAWNIANETFWENLKPTFNNLKLRFTYGLTGNDQIGNSDDRFFYLSNVNMDDAARAATFGQNWGKTLTGVSISRYANDDITWEVSTKRNLALEVGLWNKINIITEYFTEYRKNILQERWSIPVQMGLIGNSPMANVGEASGRGMDISVDYQQIWNKDFWTSARANFTYARSVFEVYEEPNYTEPWRHHKGKLINQTYGYIAERLFVDDEDARNSPPQEFGSPYGGGDIKYLDVNGDMKIDEADRVPIGNPTVPEIVYGFGLSAGYKNFDVSVFFQGAANESFWIDAWNTSPFQNETQLLKAYADSHWEENNQDKYALWPRLSPEQNYNNLQTSTWFMRDGSFLRLKQAEIGYSIPGEWKKKLHLGALRFYVSGTNLLLFSKFNLWDVEMAGNGLGYPIQRVFNVGLNLTFN